MRSFCILISLLLYSIPFQAQILDTPFKQARSISYKVRSDQAPQFQKLLVDHNNIPYVLTDQGLFRTYPGDILAYDQSYRSLADKLPVDICIQEESKHLFYLFPDQFLTNSYAGKVYADLVEDEFQMIAVNRDTEVLLIGESGGKLFSGSRFETDIPQSPYPIQKLYTYQGKFYALCKEAILHLENAQWEVLHRADGLKALAFSPNEIIIATDEGYAQISIYSGTYTQLLTKSLPDPRLSSLLFTGNKLWMGSKRGVFHEEGRHYRYYASRRWLDHDEVIDMASDQEGNIYVLTAKGLNKISFPATTLAQKATYFEDKIRQYHMRYGLVCATRRQTPFDPTSAQILDTDNDGLWTSFYLGSQAFKYATTGSPEAKRYVWESFEAYERLISVNPLKGFPSRTFERTAYQHADPDRWRDTSPDKGWVWKGTTSTDEYIAYLFVAALMDQFIVQNEDERKRVADWLDAIMTHILDNDYYLVDQDGNPTTWARWNPDYVNMFPAHVYDRKLNSMHLIAGLQLVYALTQKERYKTEAFRMMDEYGYFENMLIDMYTIKADSIKHQKYTLGDTWNHSDDEMAFLTFWPLYHYAFNDSLKTHYIDIIRNHWEIELPERNALWHLIAYGTSGDLIEEDVSWYLREYLTDQQSYKVENGHRKDLTFLPANFRGQATQRLLPASERRIQRHNSNPFILDGGRDGDFELAGDEYLLPYWMGRYLGVIK